MALSRHTVVVGITVMMDGRVQVTEREEIYEGGRTSGERIAVGSNIGRIIDLDDTVDAGEDDLVKDVINGNIQTQARIDARTAARAAERGG